MSQAIFFRGRDKRPWAYRRYDVLVCLYIEEDWTRREIADEFGVSVQTIGKYLAYHGIRKREAECDATG